MTVEIVRRNRFFTEAEEQVLAGFPSGYRGLTREAYALDLRQFVNRCSEHDVRLFALGRVEIYCFARELEAKGRARATVARFCTVAGLFRYAEEEGLIDHSPAVHADPGSITSPTPPDWTATVSAHSLSPPGCPRLGTTPWSRSWHSMASGSSEALGADIAALGLERGHRTLTVTRKGGKVVTLPLAPPPPGH